MYLANGETSCYFSCEKGVCQGENLSPLLFSIYLNDAVTYRFNDDCKGVNFHIPDETARLLVKLLLFFYADEAAVISDGVNNFQHLLNRFASYCKIWRLQININKTKIIILVGIRSLIIYCLQ